MSSKQSFDPIQLHAVFAQFPQIQAVYLFGSAARESMHAESDLDLAVVSQPSLHEAKLEILTELARAGFVDVDLVFLDKATILLRYEAVRQNQLVYATDEFDRGEFYARVVREYLDFLPCLKVQREAYKWRLLHGSQRRPAGTPDKVGRVPDNSTQLADILCRRIRGES